MSTRTSGIGNTVKGTAKEVTGKATGDRSKEVEGKAQKTVGKAQTKTADAVDDLKRKPR